MRNLILPGFIVFIIMMGSCQKDDSSSFSTSSTTTTTTAIIKITVTDGLGSTQAFKTVDMFDQEISLTQQNTVIKSAISNTNGVATFNMENLATNIPKTYYFGVFKQVGIDYILQGSRTVEGVVVGKEIDANLVLIN